MCLFFFFFLMKDEHERKNCHRDLIHLPSTFDIVPFTHSRNFGGGSIYRLSFLRINDLARQVWIQKRSHFKTIIMLVTYTMCHMYLHLIAYINKLLIWYLPCDVDNNLPHEVVSLNNIGAKQTIRVRL